MKYLCIFLLFITILGLNYNSFFENNLLDVLHPDQIIFNNYIIKSINDNNFHFDYVLSLNKNILNVYNPVEMTFSRNLYLYLNSNIYALYRVSFVVYLMIYLSIFYYIFNKISSNYLSATVFTLFSCCNILLGFSADVFGFMSFQNVRSAYYVLPFLALSLYFLIYKKKQVLYLGKYTCAFLFSVLMLNFHPVSQIHFSIIFSGLILIEVIVKRNVFRNIRLWILFVITLTPLIYNLLHNEINIKTSFTLDEFMNVMPAYKVHIPTYAITNNFHWILFLLVSGLFVISFICFIISFLFVLSDSIRRLIFKINFIFSSLLFLLVFNRGQSYFIFSFLVLLFSTIYFNLSKCESRKEFILLFIFSFSILISVVGSTVLNYLLVFFNYDILSLELMRGIRIGYVVMLFWAADTLILNKYALFYYSSVVIIFFVLNLNKSKDLNEYHADFKSLDKLNNKLNSSKKGFLYLGESYEKSIVDALLIKSISHSNTYYSYDGMNCIYSNKELISPFSHKIDSYKSLFTNKSININELENIGLIFSLKSNGPLNSANVFLVSQTKFFYIYKILK